MKNSTTEWIQSAILVLVMTVLATLVLATMYRYEFMVSRDMVLGMAIIGMFGFLLMVGLSWTPHAKASEWLRKASEAEADLGRWELKLLQMECGQHEKGSIDEWEECRQMIKAYQLERSKALQQAQFLTGERPVLDLRTGNYRIPSWVLGDISDGK